MDRKISDRLYELRKQKGLSQEELADRLGVTRQAVSKWERGESSPDTDNLIALAKLYDVSLDNLVGFSRKAEDIEDIEEKEGDNGNHETRKNIYVSDEYIEVSDGDKKVFINNNGGGKVKIVASKIDAKIMGQLGSLVSIIIAIVYILLGSIWNLWHPAWILFVCIPLIIGTTNAITKRSISSFPYPILCTVVFLILGFSLNFWHPGWVIFVTIPLYYGIINIIKINKRQKDDK